MFSSKTSYAYLPHISWVRFVLGNMHTLRSILMHERDASFLAVHLMFACFVSGSRCDCCWHKLSSRLMHEGDASFLAGHLLLTCHTLLTQFL